jgi:hypothetical protein
MVKVSAWCVSPGVPTAGSFRPTQANASQRTQNKPAGKVANFPTGFLSALAIKSQVLCQLS